MSRVQKFYFIKIQLLFNQNCIMNNELIVHSELWFLIKCLVSQMSGRMWVTEERQAGKRQVLHILKFDQKFSVVNNHEHLQGQKCVSRWSLCLIVFLLLSAAQRCIWFRYESIVLKIRYLSLFYFHFRYNFYKCCIKVLKCTGWVQRWPIDISGCWRRTDSTGVSYEKGCCRWEYINLMVDDFY